MIRKKKTAFSLVELVIVVVIIGVIAAIAVPRISRGAKGAGESSLRMSLAGLRTAIDAYAAEHGGTFPAGLQADIIAKLTQKTDKAGNPGTTAATHIYGPYLRSGIPALPVCANKGSADLELVTGMPVAVGGAAAKGWMYSTDTGIIIANCMDTEKDDAGTQFNQY
jgi:prepilin-type N-terminal cleavage/methylation domain-containing protein